jgi:hypothetical protein
MKRFPIPVLFSRLRTNLKDRFLLFLFAPLSILFQGYIYGYHDHAIQIPYIYSHLNPGLYPGDPLAQSFPYYFVPFWDLMAYLSVYMPLYPLMLISHVLFRWLLFESIFHLGIVLTNNRAGALLASSFFVMPLHCLGDFFPSPDFVHSCAAVPGLLYVIAEIIRGKHVVPLLLLGVLYNVHAMHAAFVTVIVFFILIRQPHRLRRFSMYFGGLLAMILAAPTLMAMWNSASLRAGEDWIQVIRIRASHHIFPFTWSWQWVSALIYFLGGYFCWRRVHVNYGNSLYMLLSAVALICFVGTVGAELRPIPFMMKMHTFRCVIYAICIFAVIWAQFLIERVGDVAARNKREALVFDLFVTCIGAASLIVSSYFPLLGAAVVLLCKKSRLSRVVSIIVFLIPFFFTVLAQFHYSVPLQGYLRDECLKTLLVFALAFPLFGIFLPQSLAVLPSYLRKYVYILSICLIGVLSVGTVLLKERIRARSEDIALLPYWIDIQDWAREHSSVADRFITPPDIEGFRVYSQRGIVGSWKDGTAVFWYPPMATDWLARMVDLRQIALSKDRVEGKYRDLSAGQFLDLAKKYEAGFAVVRKPSSVELPRVYENERFVVFALRGSGVE